MENMYILGNCDHLSPIYRKRERERESDDGEMKNLKETTKRTHTVLK